MRCYNTILNSPQVSVFLAVNDRLRFDQSDSLPYITSYLRYTLFRRRSRKKRQIGDLETAVFRHEARRMTPSPDLTWRCRCSGGNCDPHYRINYATVAAWRPCVWTARQRLPQYRVVYGDRYRLGHNLSADSHRIGPVHNCGSNGNPVGNYCREVS